MVLDDGILTWRGVGLSVYIENRSSAVVCTYLVLLVQVDQANETIDLDKVPSRQ